MVKLRIRAQAQALSELIGEIIDKRDPDEIHIADTDSRRDRPLVISEVNYAGKIQRVTTIDLDGTRNSTWE
jgi:hypothetical protein